MSKGPEETNQFRNKVGIFYNKNRQFTQNQVNEVDIFWGWMMKGSGKLTGVMVIFLSGSVIVGVAAQDLIKNPRKPASKNPGRVLKMQKVWKISDADSSFYFRYPQGLAIASDGSIFINDQEELLKFSADGHFLGNFYKKGQGPEEIVDFFNFCLHKDRLFVYDLIANKILQMDLEGRPIGQVKLEKGPYNGFYGLSDQHFVCVKMIYPPREERKGGLQDVGCFILLISLDGKEEKEIYEFKIKTFMSPEAMGSWDPWDALLSPDGRRLYVNHTRQYLVEVLDLEKGRVLFSFTRDYPSVKFVEDPRFADFRKKTKFPEIKYEVDIRGLFTDGRFIWVQTSTNSPDKGDLFDLFDDRGRFVDSFYLGVKGSLMAVRDGFAYILEKNEKEELLLSKYRILEQIK